MIFACDISPFSNIMQIYNHAGIIVSDRMALLCMPAIKCSSSPKVSHVHGATW